MLLAHYFINPCFKSGVCPALDKIYIICTPSLYFLCTPQVILSDYILPDVSSSYRFSLFYFLPPCLELWITITDKKVLIDPHSSNLISSTTPFSVSLSIIALFCISFLVSYPSRYNKKLTYPIQLLVDHLFQLAGNEKDTIHKADNHFYWFSSWV